MTKNILVVIGHPDPAPERYGRILAQAYIRGAQSAGNIVEVIDVARLEFPLLRSKAEYETGEIPRGLREAHAKIERAQHLVIIFPLWLGEMPALLKAFLEQVVRLGGMSTGGGQPLKGKSARIIVTMGMPSLIYRLVFRAHGLKNLKRNILGFCGVRPIKSSLIGLIENKNPHAREKWLKTAERLGKTGD
ncbi:MAG: NAD(P)H-dependent oxidoreductase [Rhodospirillaceae bacterium]